MTSLQLSELQHEILRVLWQRGEASVSEVHDELNRTRSLAPTTVATMLTRMRKRDLLIHRTEGRQFLYRAAISEGEVKRSMVHDLKERVFQGDVTALVSNLLGDRDVSAEDLARVKDLIQDREKEMEGDHD